VEECKITAEELGIPAVPPMPHRKDWRIGIIGFGSIAQAAHAPAYRDAGWLIYGVADLEENAREKARSEYGVENPCSDYHDLLADDSVEVIDLLTHPVLREEVVVAAAEAGKHLITEKPFGLSIEECERMVATVEAAGTKLAVHQNYRWMRMNFLARHIVEKGLIGDPFYTSIEIFGRQDVELAENVFYSTCDNFLTIQWDSHLADLQRYWTGHDAKRVFARTGRMDGQNFVSDNLLTVVTDFGHGLIGHVVHNELLRSSLASVVCRVDGSEGSMLFDFMDKLQIQSKSLGEKVYTMQTSSAGPVESFACSMGDFLLTLEEDREPMVSGRNNLATIRTIFAEDRSARAGGEWTDCA